MLMTGRKWKCLLHKVIVLFLFQDRKVIIKTMKTYMVKFAMVSSFNHVLID